MIGQSVLAFAMVLAAPPLSNQAPGDAARNVPTISLEELNAFVVAGNYHRIRIEKLGHVLEAMGKVETVAANGDWLIVELPGFLRATLRGLPKDHGLAVSDRVRFRGMIVDEGYTCLQVWTYDFDKLPPLTKEQSVPCAAAGLPSSAAPQAPTGPGDGSDTTQLSREEDLEDEAPDASRGAAGQASGGTRGSEPAPSPASLAKSSEELLPKVTVRDLDAATNAGEYTRVRREMLGHRLFADAVVEKVGAWPLVRLSDNWQAHLRSHSSDWRLKEGDRVRFHGLIVDEAYAAVTLWVERIETLPAEVAPSK